MPISIIKQEETMPLITWTEKYSVNIAEIDEQHKKLINMLCQLGEAMSQGKGSDVLGTILAELIDYTGYHFSAEERLFDLHGYPDSAQHKQEHAYLTGIVKKYQEDFANGNWMLTIDVLKLLTTWLNDHILGSDKKYAPFLNGKGVK
jgi:hemerythrin